MPANVAGGEIPFPVRGIAGGWRDFWQVPDALELAEIHRQVAIFDARAATLAAELQREERRERKRRERERKRRGGSG
jgi:hypothetical protein